MIRSDDLNSHRQSALVEAGRWRRAPGNLTSRSESSPASSDGRYPSRRHPLLSANGSMRQTGRPGPRKRDHEIVFLKKPAHRLVPRRAHDVSFHDFESQWPGDRFRFPIAARVSSARAALDRRMARLASRQSATRESCTSYPTPARADSRERRSPRRIRADSNTLSALLQRSSTPGSNGMCPPKSPTHPMRVALKSRASGRANINRVLRESKAACARRRPAEH